MARPTCVRKLRPGRSKHNNLTLPMTPPAACLFRPSRETLQPGLHLPSFFPGRIVNYVIAGR